MTSFLLWIYGASAIGAACNFPTWLLLFIAWFDGQLNSELRSERLLLRMGFIFNSVGLFFGCWSRASAIVVAPTKIMSVNTLFWTPFFTFTAPPAASVGWMISFFIGEVFFIATSSLVNKRAGKASYAPQFFLIAISAWTVFVATLSML